MTEHLGEIRHLLRSLTSKQVVGVEDDDWIKLFGIGRQALEGPCPSNTYAKLDVVSEAPSSLLWRSFVRVTIDGFQELKLLEVPKSTLPLKPHSLR